VIVPRRAGRPGAGSRLASRRPPMSAIAFDIEAATAVEGLAAGAITGGPTAPIGDTGARPC
jgi:hypothetical protein